MADIASSDGASVVGSAEHPTKNISGPSRLSSATLAFQPQCNVIFSSARPAFAYPEDYHRFGGPTTVSSSFTQHHPSQKEKLITKFPEQLIHPAHARSIQIKANDSQTKENPPKAEDPEGEAAVWNATQNEASPSFRGPGSVQRRVSRPKFTKTLKNGPQTPGNSGDIL